jgi:uncharacterized membrane protein
MIFFEWKGKLRWAAIASLLCLIGSTWVGQLYIIPINKIMAKTVTDQVQLTSLLERWMSLNDIRWILQTIMWLILMYYFIAKGKLTAVLEAPPQ